MYERFYGLKENPFRLTPDPAYLCMTAQHQESLSGLIYSVCTRPGLAVLMGEAGTGKTTLLYSLIELLEKRRFVTAMCTNPTLTRQEFYDLLIIKLGIDCTSPLKSRQLMAVEEALHRNHRDGRPSILIVDEAQRLSAELLEEIRLLLNMETPREKLLQIIIAGQPELGEILARPQLRQLEQRISCLCHLRPLMLEELKEYLYHRLTRAGLPHQTLFSEPVMQLIFDYTQGIPRLVNSLCDSSLQTGFGIQSPQITPSIIEESAHDLELVRGAYQAEPSAIGSRNGSGETAPLAMEVGVRGRVGRGSRTAESGKPDDSVPMESYTNRQKSLGLFANLINRSK